MYQRTILIGKIASYVDLVGKLFNENEKSCMVTNAPSKSLLSVRGMECWVSSKKKFAPAIKI